jgi:hypothetical protein
MEIRPRDDEGVALSASHAGPLRLAVLLRAMSSIGYGLVNFRPESMMISDTRSLRKIFEEK